MTGPAGCIAGVIFTAHCWVPLSDSPGVRVRFAIELAPSLESVVSVGPRTRCGKHLEYCGGFPVVLVTPSDRSHFLSGRLAPGAAYRLNSPLAYLLGNRVVDRTCHQIASSSHSCRVPVRASKNPLNVRFKAGGYPSKRHWPTQGSRRLGLGPIASSPGRPAPRSTGRDVAAPQTVTSTVDGTSWGWVFSWHNPPDLWWGWTTGCPRTGAPGRWAWCGVRRPLRGRWSRPRRGPGAPEGYGPGIVRGVRQ